MEALLATEEGNFVLGDDLGTGLIDSLVGEWRLLYTSSNAMEYNQVAHRLISNNGSCTPTAFY